MALTILLSKVFGLYFMIVGVILLFRRSYFRSIVSLFVDQPVLRFMMGIIMLIGGLFMIVSHQDWSSFSAGFISLLGWALTLKALLYLNLSNGGVKRWTGWFKVAGLAGVIAGLVYIALGFYLVNFGFALF